MQLWPKLHKDDQVLLSKNLESIDESTIQSLLDAGATESVHLEFKRDSYGSTDADKKELLKDIVAFANTLGGHLVIGIEEVDGVASSLSPLATSMVDQELLRLESIIRTGVEPVVVGLHMKRVDVRGGSLIVVQIPRSFNPPHRVIYKGSSRFYRRNSVGVHELSLAELRALFGEQRSIEDRARAFVGERFLSIQANDGPLPLPVSEGVLVMHLIPLSDYGATRRLEVGAIHTLHQKFRPIAASGFSWRINLEGYCVYQGGEICYGYTQVFRDGSIEAVSASTIKEREGRRLIPSLSLVESLVEALSSYMNGLCELEASPPILLQISIVGMKGVELGIRSDYAFEAAQLYSRDILSLPSTIIEAFHVDGDYHSVLAEQMNFLWNAFGFERCNYFNQDGSWRGV